MAVVRCRGDCRRSVEVRTIWSGFVKRKPYNCVGQVISGGGPRGLVIVVESALLHLQLHRGLAILLFFFFGKDSIRTTFEN